MKVYVDENDIDVINDLFEATNSYECWACNRDDDLEIVSLTDHDKQVRKEVCEKIQSELLDFTHKYWRVFKRNGKQYMTDYDLIECLNEIIIQIQGETK